MVLSRRQIIKAIEDRSITVDPLAHNLIGSSSIGLRLSDDAYLISPEMTLDIADESSYPPLVRVPPLSSGISIKKNQVVLAYTLEAVHLEPDYCAFISGTSDLARLGVSIVLSNFVGAGFGRSGPKRLVLEIETRAVDEILLKPGMRIGHLIICRVDDPSKEESDPAGHWVGSEPYSTLFGRTVSIDK